MGELKFPAANLNPTSPRDEEEMENIKEKIEELEEANENLENELQNKSAHLEMLLQREEGYKKQLGLPPEASIEDIQDKIDEMVELGGLSADLMELERDLEDLKRQKTTMERHIIELKRQQKRIEFEMRNITAKNTRLTGMKV